MLCDYVSDIGNLLYQLCIFVGFFLVQAIIEEFQLQVFSKLVFSFDERGEDGTLGEFVTK